jgi:hypothetical protein
MYDTRSTDSNQCHALVIARFEAHRCTRGNVQPHPESLGTLEPQRPVDFEKMIMRSHLDWAVPAIDYFDLNRFAARIGYDVTVCEEVFAWYHNVRRILD